MIKLVCIMINVFSLLSCESLAHLSLSSRTVILKLVLTKRTKAISKARQSKGNANVKLNSIQLDCVCAYVYATFQQTNYQLHHTTISNY